MSLHLTYFSSIVILFYFYLVQVVKVLHNFDVILDAYICILFICKCFAVYVFLMHIIIILKSFWMHVLSSFLFANV